MSEVADALVEPAAPDTADTSTALVDGLAEVVARLRRAGGLYARWRAHPAADRQWPEEPWGAPGDEQALADLRGIDFWAADESGARLTALSTAADAAVAAFGKAGAGLHDAWDSQITMAAELRLTDYRTALRTWQESAGQLAAAIDGAGRAVAAVLDRWADETRATDVRVHDPALRHAQLDQLDAALAAGYPVAALRTPGAIDLRVVETSPGWPSHEVLTWLDDFAARHSAETARVRRGLRATREAVEQIWQVFGQVLAEIAADPFAPLAPAPPRTDDPQVAIRDGDRTIVLTGPDERGQYQVTLDGGAHQLDFGADGRVRFMDGDTVVTATLVGPDKVAITLDDGGGPPTTYTVDAAGSAETAAPPPRADTPSTPSTEGGSGGSGGGTGGAGGGGGAAAPTPLAEGPLTGADELAEQRRAPAPAASAGGPPAAGGQAGGMPMGGGMMGGMGGGQGQGGDSERKPSTWRIAGNIFDDTDPVAGFDGVIGAEPAAPA